MKVEALAFGAAVVGVFAAWDAIELAAALGSRVASLTAPLRGDREAGADERRRLTAIGALAAAAACWILAGPLLAIVGAATTPFAVRRVLSTQARKRRTVLVDAAPVVARAIADALAGGSSIRAALAGAHAGGAIGSARRELGAMRDALELGEETERVLERLRSTANHRAYDAIVAAILLQREAGGDLAGLLRRLATSLEHDARAEADARAATAQARFSAGLVAWLPAIAAGFAEIAAPGSVAALLTSPLSAILAGAAIALQLLGWLVIRRVSAVDT